MNTLVTAFLGSTIPAAVVAAETEKLACRAPPYAFFTQRVADQQWLGRMYVLKKLGLGWEGTLSLG